jgi:hypothetical protein
VFLGRLFNRLGGDDQIYMQNLAHSLLYIQNSRGLVVEKRDGEAVIAVKPAILRETACQDEQAAGDGLGEYCRTEPALGVSV